MLHRRPSKYDDESRYCRVFANLMIVRQRFCWTDDEREAYRKFEKSIRRNNNLGVKGVIATVRRADVLARYVFKKIVPDLLRRLALPDAAKTIEDFPVGIDIWDLYCFVSDIKLPEMDNDNALLVTAMDSAEATLREAARIKPFLGLDYKYEKAIEAAKFAADCAGSCPEETRIAHLESMVYAILEIQD